MDKEREAAKRRLEEREDRKKIKIDKAKERQFRFEQKDQYYWRMGSRARNRFF